MDSTIYLSAECDTCSLLDAAKRGVFTVPDPHCPHRLLVHHPDQSQACRGRFFYHLAEKCLAESKKAGPDAGQHRQAAYQHFEQAGRCPVLRPQSQYTMGDVLFEMGKYSKSLDHYKAAIDTIMPKSGPATAAK